MLTAALIARRQPRRVAPPTSDGATAPRRDSRAAQRGETLPPGSRSDRSAVPARTAFYAQGSGAVSGRTRNRKRDGRLFRTAARLSASRPRPRGAEHRHAAKPTPPVASIKGPPRVALMPAVYRNQMGRPRRQDTPPGFGVRLGPAHWILPRRLLRRVTAGAAARRTLP